MDNLDIYEMLDRLRALDEANESMFDQQDADTVPYTSQDTLMTNTLESAKQEFGADFNKIKNPMLYYPKDGDITLSGIIPEMNDAKFQFRYKVGDGAGCYVWSNPYLPISDKTIQLLSKVNGVCKNWRDEISKSEDCKPSNYRDPEDQQNNAQGQASEGADAAGMGADMTEGGDAAAGQEGQQQLAEDVRMIRVAMNRINEASEQVRRRAAYERLTPGDDAERIYEGFRNGDDMELVGRDALNAHR